ncbi:MAG TPA: right-handed parallel beta-helix repeat-containing protein, partial [Tepidisphaeraceae bacterium]|nr:right-handed parallel beta-helix repeat-containing protein [Tepidisphaeraceae bacterium]
YAGDTIEVAQGTYYPSYDDDTTQSFNLIDGVTMEGGFGGNLLASQGGDPNTRNVAAYPTILSGLLGGSTSGPRSYQVVFADQVNDSTVFDGFTVTGGDGESASTYNTPATGGGMYLYFSSPIINDCTFTANFSYYGSGLEVADASNPTITNCTFLNDVEGAGLECDQGSSPAITDCTFNEPTEPALNDVQNCDPTVTDCTFNAGNVVGFRSDPTLIDCTFLGNRAEDGGAVDAEFSSAILINCLIEGDGATYNGGAIYSYQGTVSVTNCTIVNCTAGNAFGAISATDSTVTVSNSIIYGDGPDPVSASAAVTYSDVQGGFTGTGNINASPGFVGTNNFQLEAGSPCINAGDNADVPSGVTTDLAGNPRIVGGAVDMGAYEYQGVTAITWTGAADGVNWGVAGNWSDDQVPTSTTSIIIPSGDTPKIGTATFAVASIMLQGAATVDVGSGKLFIDYGTSPDPIASIVSYLTSGYDAGKWKGTGITSSAVASEDSSQTAAIYAVGYADGADGLIGGLNSGQIEIMPTLAGDAKLQGNVVFGDFQILAQYFGKPGSWDTGDFNYGTNVVFGDFQLLAQDFGKTSSLSGSFTASNPITSATSAPPGTTTGSAADSILDGALDIGDASPFSDLLLDS